MWCETEVWWGSSYCRATYDVNGRLRCTDGWKVCSLRGSTKRSAVGEERLDSIVRFVDARRRTFAGSLESAGAAGEYECGCLGFPRR